MGMRQFGFAFGACLKLAQPQAHAGGTGKWGNVIRGHANGGLEECKQAEVEQMGW